MFVVASLGVPSTTSLPTGNILWVDAVFGNDATATRGDAGFPYLTVGAAITDALSGDSVICRPGTYNLPAAGLVLPTGVALQGTSHSNTILQLLNVTADTTLLDMGISTHVVDVTLHLTSAEHHTLTGVLFNGVTGGTAQISNSRIIVDNSGAGAGTSIVTGVLVQSSGIPIVLDQMDSVVTVVSSIGLGRKRGILMDTAAGRFFVAESDTQIDSPGSIDCIAVETNFAGCYLQYLTGSIATSPSAPAASNANISQTLGTLAIGSVALLQTSCRERNFLALTNGAPWVWGEMGPLTNGVRYLRPGQGTSVAAAQQADVQTRFARARIVKTLSIHASVAPGGAATCSFTVMKNGIATLLTATLGPADVTATNLVNAAEFAEGDLFSCQANDGGATADVLVTVEIT